MLWSHIIRRSGGSAVASPTSGAQSPPNSGRSYMPDTLYHYTDANGLLGILDQREIWCTHIAYLNDAKEYRVGIDLWNEMLKDLDEQPPTEVRAFVRAARARLQYKQPMEQLLKSRAHFFVASFSEEDDDLAQWRGYSGSGPKFSIGFNI